MLEERKGAMQLAASGADPRSVLGSARGTRAFAPPRVVPAYQAAATVGRGRPRAPRERRARLVVDDGSTDETGAGGRARRAPRSCASPENGGKGAARARRPRAASSRPTRRTSRSWTPTASTIRRTCRGSSTPRASGDDFVIGSRMGDPDAIPAYRYRTNEIGSRILSRMTGLEVEDAQSGYRVVAADVLRRLRSEGARIHHRDRDPAEGRAATSTRFRHVPVRAIYGGPSHYRPFRDTWIISWGAVYYKVFETRLTSPELRSTALRRRATVAGLKPMSCARARQLQSPPCPRPSSRRCAPAGARRAS